jgi:hypothetical protein
MHELPDDFKGETSRGGMLPAHRSQLNSAREALSHGFRQLANGDWRIAEGGQMRGAWVGLAIFLGAAGNLHAAQVREDYVLLTAHIDSATVRKRTAEGRVLEFVDVIGRKNRCVYAENGRVKEIRFSSEYGDFTTRFIYDKRDELTTIVLADSTAVQFREGKMRPAAAKPTLAESYAAALEHWLAKNNSGL